MNGDNVETNANYKQVRLVNQHNPIAFHAATKRTTNIKSIESKEDQITRQRTKFKLRAQKQLR